MQGPADRNRTAAENIPAPAPAEVFTLLTETRHQIDPLRLMKAALQGHAPTVTLLLADERVNPNMATVKGWTALMLAAMFGHPRW